MRIIEVEQGTPEWHQERAGAITASMFGEVCRRLKSGADKGKHTKEARAYAMRLAVERISGEPLDEADKFETYSMRRGRELEPKARAIHERRIGKFIMEAGIVLTDDGHFGASADGLIDEDEGSEYKCFIDPTKLNEILLEQDISGLQYQIQGCLWLTGRKRWHFGLYCPALESIGLDFTLHIVERDEDFIAEMEENLLEFDALVESYKARLIQLGIDLNGVNAETGEIF